MEQEQKALDERIAKGEDVVVDNPTEGEERVVEMNVGIVAGGDDEDSADWTEDSGKHRRFPHFFCSLLEPGMSSSSPAFCFCPRTRFARVAT